MHIGSRRWLRLCAPAAKLLHGAALRRVGDPTGLYLAPSPRYAAKCANGFSGLGTYWKEPKVRITAEEPPCLHLCTG